MLFSATMPAWVKSLTRKHLKSPTLVDLVGDSESGRINEAIKCAPAWIPYPNPTCGAQSLGAQGLCLSLFTEATGSGHGPAPRRACFLQHSRGIWPALEAAGYALAARRAPGTRRRARTRAQA
jgi:hypothetical protein